MSDSQNQPDPLDDFSDPVEIGASMKKAAEDREAAAPDPEPAPTPDPEPAPAAGDGEEGEGEGGGPQKKGQTSEYIKRLRKRLQGTETERDDLRERVERLEGKGLPEGSGGDSPPTAAAPDPDDREKYPLGVLDENYIEDKLDYLSRQRAREIADEARRSDRAAQEERSAEAEQARLLQSVENVASKGVERFEDFHDAVVERALNGEYPLSQATFEAVSEAEFGAEILYNLANDEAEAAKVAGMSPYKQAEYVFTKNSEIAAKSKPRTKPKAGEPPKNAPSGRQGSVPFRGDEDDLDDFDKGFYANQ